MKSDGGYKIAMLEATEAFGSADVPQADCLVHRGRQQEVVLPRSVSRGLRSAISCLPDLAPAEVEHIRRVSDVLAERLCLEDRRVQAHRLPRLVDRYLLVLVRLSFLSGRDDGPDADDAILTTSRQKSAIDAELQRPGGAGARVWARGTRSIGRSRLAASMQFLCQEDPIEVRRLLVMRTDLDVFGRGGVMWNEAIGGDGMGEDVGVHAFGATLPRLRLIIGRIMGLIFLLGTNNPAQERHSFSVVECRSATRTNL